jgi:hypothetical protein
MLPPSIFLSLREKNYIFPIFLALRGRGIKEGDLQWMEGFMTEPLAS